MQLKSVQNTYYLIESVSEFIRQSFARSQTLSLIRLTMGSLLICTSLGCVKIAGTLKHVGVNDFAKTEFVVNGEAPADGVTGLLVGLQLKNSDNSSVPDYTPQYELVSGTNLNGSTCTTSDQNGISACILRSTVAGTKTISLVNAKVGLQQNVVFSSPAGGHLLNTISAAGVNVPTTAGSKVTLSMGEPHQGITRTTQSGYKLTFTAIGAGVSQ